MYCLRHLSLTWFKGNNLFSHWSQVNSQKQCRCPTHTSCLTCSDLAFPPSWVLPAMYCLSCFYSFWILLWVVICHQSYSYSQKLILYFDTWHSPLAHSRQLINWSWFWQSVGKKYELCGQTDYFKPFLYSSEAYLSPEMKVITPTLTTLWEKKRKT